MLTIFYVLFHAFLYTQITIYKYTYIPIFYINTGMIL